VREALKGADLAEGILLSWLIKHMHGDWESCDAIARAHDLDQAQLQDCYTDAVAWADRALSFA